VAGESQYGGRRKEGGVEGGEGVIRERREGGGEEGKGKAERTIWLTAGTYFGLVASRSVRCLTPKLLLDEKEGELEDARKEQEERQKGRKKEENAPDTNALHLPLILRLTAPLPHLRPNLGPSIRVVNKIQINVLQPSFLQALIDALDGPLRIELVVVQFGGEEDLGTGGASAGNEVVDGAATVGFVFVPFGTVDVLFSGIVRMEGKEKGKRREVKGTREKRGGRKGRWG
jgi:hypothetical protein